MLRLRCGQRRCASWYFATLIAASDANGAWRRLFSPASTNIRIQPNQPIALIDLRGSPAMSAVCASPESDSARRKRTPQRDKLGTLRDLSDIFSTV
jgi:hypothetical protein